MKFTVKKIINPQDTQSPARFHPTPVYIDTMDLDALSSDVSHSTSMTPADVRAVIVEVVTVLQKNLIRRVKIKIDGLGLFKLSFGGTGHENAKEVSALDISGVKVTYIADAKIKKFISSSISFEKKKENKNDEDVTEGAEGNEGVNP